MEETEHHCQDEYFEERHEDVGVGETAEDNSQEGGETSVEDCGSNGSHGPHRSIMTGSLGHHEGQPNMDGVVHTKTDGEDNVDAGDDIDGDLPEMEESYNVGESNSNDAHDVDTNLEVCQQDKSYKEDAANRHDDISPQLHPNDFICFPGCVDLAM